LRWHLDKFAEPGIHGLAFVGPQRGPLRRHGFRKRWVQALTDAGVQPVHFHDLHHTGNTMAAAIGASTRELMTRMGQSSSRTALIYQHATSERDRLIADAINRQVLHLRQPVEPPLDDADGGLRARRGHGSPARAAVGRSRMTQNWRLTCADAWGGRSRDRTCDPLLVREVLYR
jgi:hypothetical protein